MAKMVGAVSRSQFRQQLLRLNTTNILKVSLQLKTPALARLALVRKILDSSVTERSRDVESNGYSDALSEDKGAADLHTPHDLEVDEDVALLQNFERCFESVQEYSFGDLCNLVPIVPSSCGMSFRVGAPCGQHH